MSLNLINVYFRASVWEKRGYYTESKNVGPPGGWFHLVLNYAPRMFEVYVNAQKTLEDRTRRAKDSEPADGRIVLGRAYSGVDDHYTSMEVDEVEFFNEWLDPPVIQGLYTRQRI